MTLAKVSNDPDSIMATAN